MEHDLYAYPGSENALAYELLNQCSDPDQLLERGIWQITDPKGKTLIDVGAGSGFHAVRYSELAEHVFALEPDVSLRRQLFSRLSKGIGGRISVLAAGAAEIPLATATIDIAIARFAYFFGDEKCLPGISEVWRILKPNGFFFIIDACPERGLFGTLAKQAYPEVFRPQYTRENKAFYTRHGFKHYEVDTVFRAPDRDALEIVFRMDYPHMYDKLLQQVPGLELSYSMSIYYYFKEASQV